MRARGFSTYSDFDKFLEFSLKDLKDPSVLKDMDKAVARIIEAFQKNQKICLYADYDMDGTPGLALLLKALQMLGFRNLTSFQPNRFEHGYGVHKEIVEDFIVEHGVDLFITIDVGITDVAAVEQARTHNVDFIITDHHQQKEILPPAYAIVNPNQRGCESDLGHLCGTGVAFFLVLALRRKMTELGLLTSTFDPKKLLDCFAIATLTDMVPLIKENRTLVQHGLVQLARTERVGIRLLMEKLNLLGKRSLSSTDISIQFSPKLNALGRMNSSVNALDLFLVSNADSAEQMVANTLEAQKLRADTQRQSEEKISERLAEQQSATFIFEWSADFHKGIVGLLATKATQNFWVPSFVGSQIDGKIVGSARAPEGGSVLDALEYASATLKHFGGHHQAAGFELDLDQTENFRQKLHEFYDSRAPQAKVLHYDFVATLDELNDEFKSWFMRLEPYGVGFKLPILRMDHLFVANVRVLKEKHLKLVLKDISGNKIEALWFFADRIEEKRKLTSQRVRVIVEPSINEYMGQQNLQVLIRDLQVEY